MTPAERVVGTLLECGVEARISMWQGRQEVFARAAGRSLLVNGIGTSAFGPTGKRPRIMHLGPLLGAGHGGLWGTLRALDILRALAGDIPCPAMTPHAERPALLPPDFACVVDERGAVEAVGETGKAYMGQVFAERLRGEAATARAELEVHASGALVTATNAAGAEVLADLWQGLIIRPDGTEQRIPEGELHAGTLSRVFEALGVREFGTVRRLRSPRGTNAQRYEYRGDR